MSAPLRAAETATALEVVPNGQALAVVRSWLPAPADDDEEYDAMLDWGDQPERDEPQRPARLGLGAKYLSHARAAALMDPIGRKMQRQLGANRAARLAVDGEAEPADARGARVSGFGGPARAGGERGFGRGHGDRLAAAAEPPPAQAAAGSDDDDEGDMRSSAFKHKRAAAPALPLSAKKRRKLKQFLAERAR